MKRPAWQHYPGDWRSNAKLRRCSWAARGVWMEVLGLMHDSEEYGVLRWPLKEIANGVGCPLSLARELAEKEVIKGHDKQLVIPYVYAPSHGGKRGAEVILIPTQDGPIWFSSRMVRDEYKRNTSGGSGRFGKLSTDPPDPSPSRRHGEQPSQRHGERQGAKSNPPSQRQGTGASSAFKAITLGLSEPLTTAREAGEGQNISAINAFKVKTVANHEWWKSEAGIDAKGRELGVGAMAYETYSDYKARLFKLIAERERGAA